MVICGSERVKEAIFVIMIPSNRVDEIVEYLIGVFIYCFKVREMIIKTNYKTMLLKKRT